ncbi:MAG: TRAP transporter large permease subunit [Thioalkalispiraceae bacterium]|jgi:tripartite ATP-independent transporter DctM subunit
MLLPELMIILLVLSVFAVLLSGYPVAFAYGGTALVFYFIGIYFMPGTFDDTAMNLFDNNLTDLISRRDMLIAVPLFVFMGVMLERSKVAEQLLETMGLLFGPLRGGLGISVLIVGMLLAASTGIVGATCVTMGLLSLPTMLKRNYDPKIAAGTICASGTLGQIIPPSIVLILLGDQIATEYQNAQSTMNNFSPDTVSVGDLFAGALIPGLILVGLYLVYLIAIAIFKPDAMPAIPKEERNISGKQLFIQTLTSLVPPIVLIILVLGAIFVGAAAAYEAAAVGAVGAMILATINGKLVDITVYRHYFASVNRHRFALGIFIVLVVFILLAVINIKLAASIALLAVFLFYMLNFKRIRFDTLREVMQSTVKISSMVFLIFIGAMLFTATFKGFGGNAIVESLLSDLPGGVFGAMFVVMLIMFLLGFILDFVEISLVIVPIVAPIIFMFGYDPATGIQDPSHIVSPVWFGVMIAINLQTSFLTPPFGFSLFYVRGVAPPEITTLHIYKGVIPFIAIQLITLLLLAIWPELATWLADKV